MQKLLRRELIVLAGLASIFLVACTRKDIEFGGNPENSYTRLVYVDTISPSLSTVVLDSFITNNAQSFLLGKYKDPYIGIVSARPFFQMIPSTTPPTIPATAIYDSIVFMVKLNHYYYGDTSRSQTIHVNELAQGIQYTYSTNLYNKSNVPVLPTELGSATVRIRPNVDSIVNVKLNDSKGLELFNKLSTLDPTVLNAATFIDYFKGVSLSVGDNDTTAVYGLAGAEGSQVMRVYFHTTTPYNTSISIDFTSTFNNLAFNQILTDRTGTPLATTTGQKEFPSTQTNNLAFSQYGTGLLLKATFPTLKSILKTNDIVKLKKAELVFKPLGYSYDPGIFRLPSPTYLSLTGGTNTIGTSVLDSLGQGVEYVAPVIDNIYSVNTYYRFDVTTYINSILTAAGTDDEGFFLLENQTFTTPKIDRAIIGNALNTTYQTQLRLTLIIINQ